MVKLYTTYQTQSSSITKNMQKTDYVREYSNSMDHYFLQNNQTATTLIGNENNIHKYQISNQDF